MFSQMFLVFPKCSAHDRSKRELRDLQPFHQLPQREPLHHRPGVCSSHWPLERAEVNRSLSPSPPLAILPFLSMHFIEDVPLRRSIILFQVIHELCLATGERKTGVVISHSSTFPLQMSNKRRRKKKSPVHTALIKSSWESL